MDPFEPIREKTQWAVATLKGDYDAEFLTTDGQCEEGGIC